MKRILLSVLTFGMLFTVPARADDPGVLTAAAGMYDLVSHRPHAFEGRLSYRLGWGVLGSEDGAFRGLKPFAGFMYASNDAMYGYAGLTAPLQWGRFELEPQAGIGAYHRGHGLELGGTFEFHLGVGVSYAVSERMRIGAEITHISNAGTHKVNPGLNSALGTISFTFP